MSQHFQFRASRFLAGLLIVIHASAFVALLLLVIPVWARAIFTILLIINLLYLLQRDAWLYSPTSIVGLVKDDNNYTLLRRDGASFSCQISGDSLVAAQLVVLRVLPQGACFMRSIIIMPDTLDAETFRELRVCLKWNQVV